MTKVNRTETIYIKADDTISKMCHIAKNLYNEANYIIRQEFIGNGNWIRYYDLWQELKISENYHSLPGNTAQQILRSIDKSWKSFFRSIKDWGKNKHKYFGMPGLPKYKDKAGETVLSFTKMQVRIKDGILRLPKKIGLEVKTRIKNAVGARIVPLGVGYNLEIMYEKTVPEAKQNGRIASIDLGVNNLITMVNNIGEQPIIVKGGIAKSMNQFFNKKKAQLQSIYDHQGYKTGYASQKLSLKRNRKINNHLHTVSRRLITWCIAHDIATIVVGRNERWKQRANMGKRKNQNFVSIPFYKLLNMLTYKGEEYGITVIPQEESYTSKCSFLDNESIKKHKTYLGKRIARGLFRTASGILLNADINGAYNIMKKAFPNAFVEGIEGLGVVPRRLSI